MSLELGEPCLLGSFGLPQVSPGLPSSLAITARGDDFGFGRLEGVGDSPEPVGGLVYVLLSTSLLVVVTLGPAPPVLPGSYVLPGLESLRQLSTCVFALLFEPGKLLFGPSQRFLNAGVPSGLMAEQLQIPGPVSAGRSVDLPNGLAEGGPEDKKVVGLLQDSPENLGGRGLGVAPPEGCGKDIVSARCRQVPVALVCRFAHDASQVQLPPPRKPDVDVLGGSCTPDDKDRFVGSQALGLVDRDAVREGNLVFGVVDGQDDLAPTFEGGDQQRAVLPAGEHLPAVTVPHPSRRW